MGEVVAEGVVSTLFSGSLGLSVHNTGRVNIKLGLKLLGTPRAKLREKAEDIEAFCELGSYLDLPMATYSAGMRARLSFGIATSIDSKNRIQSVMQSARILILASHALPVIEEFCNKAIWLERGEIRLAGPLEPVFKEYRTQAPLPGATQKSVANR
jgi:ABC-type polysaccharide/polyol phosphate transport system ATPase subunit